MKHLSFFIDTHCLFEEKYTGIPIINYQVANYFYYNFPQSSYFFKNNKVFKNEFIEFLLNRRSGQGINDILSTDNAYIGSLDAFIANSLGKTIGIFSHLKPFRKKFDYEIQIIHDLTPLITPEFHHPETIKNFLFSIAEDIYSNDFCVSISESTKEDLITYLHVSEEKILVSYYGCNLEIRHHPIYQRLNQELKPKLEEFILILGTFEPRKNNQIVFSFLEKNPKILEKYRFVFAGKEGWGETFKGKLAKLKVPDYLKNNEILFLEYVTEEEKNVLLMNAEFLIFPSFYEGFGLPVLDALNLGCPVLASFSSSIPEIAGDSAFYFDPYDLTSFEKAFNQIVKSIQKERNKIVQNGYKRAESFSWKRFFSNIIERVLKDLEKLE